MALWWDSSSDGQFLKLISHWKLNLVIWNFRQLAHWFFYVKLKMLSHKKKHNLVLEIGKMSAVRSQDPTWSWWARVCPSASTLTTNSDSTFTFSLGTRETMEKKDSVVAPETMEDEPAADWLPRTPTQSLSLSSLRKFLKLTMKLNS